MVGYEQKARVNKKETFYLTDEFGPLFINGRKLVKYFKQETQTC